MVVVVVKERSLTLHAMPAGGPEYRSCDSRLIKEGKLRASTAAGKQSDSMMENASCRIAVNKQLKGKRTAESIQRAEFQ